MLPSSQIRDDSRTNKKAPIFKEEELAPVV